jgi:hypothetical protein
MGEVKYDKSHPAGGTAEARISSRLRNSGEGLNADTVVQKGSGPTRTFHNIVRSPNVDHGTGGPEKPGGRGLDERGKLKQGGR